MKDSIMFYNTMAENYIHFAALMVALSQEHLVEVGGAKKIIEIEGPVIVDKADDSGHEVPPGGHAAGDCDYILYQFKDNSQIWYVRTPSQDYLQLRGYYAGAWRQTEFTAARQNVMEKKKAATGSYPALWNEDISGLGLNVRAQNCLKGENIHYIGELIQRKAVDILAIPRLGKGTFKDIAEAMNNLDLNWETDVGDWEKP
jgi:hypothetical protein